MPKISEVPLGADADLRDTDTLLLTQPTAAGATTYRQRRYTAAKLLALARSAAAQLAGATSFSLGNNLHFTSLGGNGWITSNARHDGTNWLRIDPARTAFAINFQTVDNIPYEANTRGLMYLRATPGANPISPVFGAVGGWEVIYGMTEYRDLWVGGFGIELDGGGVLPYVRTVHSGGRGGILTNLFLDYSGVDDPAKPSWFAGVKGDSFVVERAAPGGTGTTSLATLFRIDANGAITPAPASGTTGGTTTTGTATGTSFTPGRSVSLVAGVLEAGGYYNVRSFGAIGDGTSRTLAQMASFRGQNTSGWTLAQWQAVMPHVTALSNQLDWACVQDALRACKAAGGGTVYVPRGVYVMDAANPVSLPCNPVVNLRGDGVASVLSWPNDLGAGRHGIVGEDPNAIESWIEITDLRLQGNGNNVAMGVRPYQMSGLHMHRVMRVHRCFIRGFFAGIYITHDHNQITHSFLDNNYYNVYFGYIDGQTFGNHYVAYNDLAHAKFASVGVHWANSADMFTLYSCHMGFGPYAMYKEAAPAGQTPRFFLTNSIWTDVFCEACGNGGFYDENTNCDTSFNCFDNVNIDMNAWGDGMYVIAARPVTAAIHVGRWLNNRVTGSQELVSSSTVRGRGVQAAVICRGPVSGNEFGSIGNWINDSRADGRPYLLTGDYGEGNTWRNGAGGGFLAQVVDQSATVPAGTLMRTRYGTIHALPWDGQAPVAGVTQMPAPNNSLVPIATSGIATVRKTGVAVGGGTRMAASLAAVGAAEPHATGVQSPAIGQSVFDAAAGDATLGVRLDLANPRYVGNTPSLTYSRATENAAQAQLRAALVAQGLVLDATTA